MVILAGFLPSSFNSLTVLEDIGGAFIESFDVLVVVIRHGTFLDAHDSYGARSHLYWISALSKIGGIGGATVRQVSAASFVGSPISITSSIVGVADDIIGYVSEYCTNGSGLIGSLAIFYGCIIALSLG